MNLLTMLGNYFKIAIRTLLKNRISSLVNIAGLALGMAAFILIIQYVRFELSYDDFHKNARRIYRVQQDRYNNGVLSTRWAAGCSAVGQALFENFNEIENFTRFQIWKGIFSYENTKFREENIFMADTSFFKIFSFQVLIGNPADALRNPFAMFISESTARKYFGSQDPIGKSLRYNGGEDFSIMGVFKDVPRNSHLKPDIITSWETMVHYYGPEVNTAWRWDSFFNYLLLRPGTDPKELETMFPNFINKRVRQDMEGFGSGVIYHLQQLNSIHLHSDFMFEAEPNGNARSVYALMIIAVFLLIIAWINYINLAGVQSLARAREVGQRKVNGAHRTQLLFQFLFESFLINLVAMTLAILLVVLLNPAFNSFAGTKLNYALSMNIGFWLSIMLIFIIGAIISGLYPSLFLSSFKPIAILRGISELKLGGLALRRILVIFQFSISLLFIAVTIAVYLQISYMKKHDLGVDIKDVLVLTGPGINDSGYNETFDSFKSELIRNPDIKKVTTSTQVPGHQSTWITAGVRRLNDNPDVSNLYQVVAFDFDFINFYGLSIIEGRNFSERFGRNSKTVLLNETAVELMDFPNPMSAIGVPIFFRGDTLEIVGVIKNFHHVGLKTKFEPLIFKYFRNSSTYYSLKINPGATREVLTFVKDKWNQFFPLNPFEYFFLEEYYNKQYINEAKFGKVFGLFSVLAILIASLGLFGLASYTSNHRRREIGLRKVLGSSSGDAVLLLLRYFIIQVGMAVPIGLGIAYIITKSWLDNFAFRISIGWWFFCIPVLIVLLTTLLTVIGRVLKTANVNPARSLKYE